MRPSSVPSRRCRGWGLVWGGGGLGWGWGWGMEGLAAYISGVNCWGKGRGWGMMRRRSEIWRRRWGDDLVGGYGERAGAAGAIRLRERRRRLNVRPSTTHTEPRAARPARLAQGRRHGTPPGAVRARPPPARREFRKPGSLPAH